VVSVYFGTFENKVDRKGRVSVPAPFRQILATSAFQGIIAFRYHTPNAMEACSLEFMERLDRSVSDFDLFSEEHDDLAFNIFAESHQLPFDGEGRVILPAALLEITGIEERAAFVGKGPTFQIWEPAALQDRKAEARLRAPNLTLRLRRDESGGGS
jgi:transcriptional regulator MraZ